MAESLWKAAERGDVNLLREVASDYNSFIQCLNELGSKADINIFNVAAWNEKVEFFKEAMKLMSEDHKTEYLFNKDSLGCTPLHAAATGQNNGHAMVKLIIDFYTSYAGAKGIEKPWLALDIRKRSPLHAALSCKENEKCAMEILLMDVQLLSEMVDADGNSPLFLAVMQGYNQVAETILISCRFSSSTASGANGSTPLHFAPNCSQKVWRLLLMKCGDCFDKTDIKGHTALHVWAKRYSRWLCELLLKITEFPEARTKIFEKLIFSQNLSRGDTPLHIATAKHFKLSRLLVEGYQQYMSENKEAVSVECPPWKIKNKSGNTPLHIALSEDIRNEEFAVQVVSIDPTSCWIRNDDGESPLFFAVRYGCEQAMEEMLRTEEVCFDMLCRNDGQTVLHCLPSCTERTARRLLEKYWWIINLTDDNKKTALDVAKEADVPWLVSLLRDPSQLQKESFNWISACERGEKRAIFAFLDNCQDPQRIFHEANDTPLHHIKLLNYKDYNDFLKIPSVGELKNKTDRDGATPLHRALEREDMLLAKALLIDDEVDRDIADRNGITGMKLLADLCKKYYDWELMCKEIKVNPYLKTSYVQQRTNLKQMRSILSVVAALLATITFAAGFTLPGGFNSTTGEAVLARDAAFAVFLLADVYAMCTAIFVLFCLIWSLVSKPDMTRLLVDRSVFVLMQSLYATLLAYMTGIYTVIAKRSLWAAILIFVMCSVIGITANKTILHSAIAKFVPASNKRDRMLLLEEGSAGSSSTWKTW